MRRCSAMRVRAAIQTRCCWRHRACWRRRERVLPLRWQRQRRAQRGDPVRRDVLHGRHREPPHRLLRERLVVRLRRRLQGRPKLRQPGRPEGGLLRSEAVRLRFRHRRAQGGARTAHHCGARSVHQQALRQAQPEGGGLLWERVSGEQNTRSSRCVTTRRQRHRTVPRGNARALRVRALRERACVRAAPLRASPSSRARPSPPAAARPRPGRGGSRQSQPGSPPAPGGPRARRGGPGGGGAAPAPSAPCRFRRPPPPRPPRTSPASPSNAAQQRRATPRVHYRM